jgi:L-lysine exporter family protein LysE/ArgO
MPSAVSVFFMGFALSAALILAIGAQNLFVLRQALRREHIGAIVLFCGSADALLIAIGVAGVGALLAVLPQLATLLMLAGAVFLGWYGISAWWRMATPGTMAVASSGGLTLGRTLAATAGFTFLNPHVYLDTVMLMGTAGSAQPAMLRPFFVAGAATASFTWFAALGYGARLLAPLFARPGAWRVLDALVGATMLALAGSLLLRAFA